MSDDLNPRAVKWARWFFFCAGLFLLLIAAAEWLTGVAVSVWASTAAFGGWLLLFAKYGSDDGVMGIRGLMWLENERDR